MARVLVVDDEDNQVRVLAIGLRLEGFEVETARSGELALAALAGQSFDLAIVDLMMPTSNGLDLSRKIREAHPHTRVVLTSAYHLSERQLARADCGVVGFVPKPYEMSELAVFLRSKLPPSGKSLAAAALVDSDRPSRVAVGGKI